MVATVWRGTEHMAGRARTGQVLTFDAPASGARVAIKGKHTELTFKVSATGFELAMRPMP